MSKGPKAKAAKPLTFDQAASELPVAVAKARAESTIYSEAYEQCILQLRLLHSIMARERAKSKSAMLRVDELRAIVDEGEGHKVLKPALVPNPMITQGLLDAVESGEVATQHDRSIGAMRNEVVLVGGLARVRGKSEAQFLAAARYCHLYETSQIGPLKATDYSQLRVDTSGPRQDHVSASQDDARSELEAARKCLGPRAASIVDQIVVHGQSVRGLADKLKLGQGGQARRRLEKELLAALDELAALFGMLPKDRAKQTGWRDGERLPLIATEGEPV
ncbi:DUF6456 domain-containing protein [Devosia sp. A449]